MAASSMSAAAVRAEACWRSYAFSNAHHISHPMNPLRPPACATSSSLWHLPTSRASPSNITPACRARSSIRVSSSEEHPGSSREFITLEEVQQIAASRGLCLYVTSLGPFYRVICREGSEEGKVLGLTTGFLAPLFNLMHCDTLQVFTKGLRGEQGQRVRGGALGLGLLLGGATFSYGFSRGCSKAEILAINDYDDMHSRLVRYYSYFGFEPVVEVEGGRMQDLPHMLVWGGAGTRMDADIAKMLAKWTPAFRRSLRQQASELKAMEGAASGSSSLKSEGLVRDSETKP